MRVEALIHPKRTGYEAIREWLRPKLARYVGSTAEQVILGLPDMAVFLVRLMADPRTPLARKLLAGAAIGYLVTPIDLTPDFLPFWGFIDDLFLVALAVRELIRSSDPDAVKSHWPGSEDALAVVEKTLDWVEKRVPERLWKRWKAYRLY